ncbi:hypothetical protein EXE10_15765 [Acinetobacter sp. WCHAc060033]|uniref:hypothetical protein n=1 Tax=Acinetobacter sp. WCHAc060033 TaxID=2518624 RepID=UPI00102367B1|nr:hypothetical protein [Acinetobacter sp. WCHAc060033]RZG79455.1 hypothetical protein EXE10_15765 [Acinetobacter sp. WCHAc060033]
MNNFYFYQSKLNETKSNLIICFYSGRDLCVETFYNEVLAQFKIQFFSEDIIFITHQFNKDDVSEKLLNNISQENLKDRINSFQKIKFHTCFIDLRGNFQVNTYNQYQCDFNIEEIQNILEIGLLNIIIKRNLVITPPANIHFIKPSGKHTTKFIDVKNILESSPEISFIATNILRLLPDNKNIEKIYIDTSGIYSLAFELSNLIRCFNESYKPIPIDSFGSYGRFEDYQFNPDQNTLVLISASTSNELYKELKRPERLTEDAHFITLFMTQKNDECQNVLVEFVEYYNLYKSSVFENFKSYNDDNCPMCADKSSVPVPLGKDRFDFSAPRTSAYLPIAKDSDEQLKSLISDYKSFNIFKCLFDGVDGRKPKTPEYFIDVRKVVKTKKFKEKVIDKFINRHFPLNTDCIIYCKDQGAKELANFIKRTVAKKQLSVKLYEGAIPENVEINKGIIVVAGSLESGKALLNISRTLRKFHEQPITYVIGFAKYNSEADFKKLQNDLKFSTGPSGHHSIHVIEKILLPINEHDEIIWDKEIEFLNSISPQYSQNPSLKMRIDSRIELLKNCRSIEVQGLGESLFLNTINTDPLVLGKSFAFWNPIDNKKEFKHQATVYFTISSILQKLRTEKGKSGLIPLGDGYIIRQLDPLLFDRFNEGIIQASVLRCAKSKELDYRDNDNQSKIIGSLIERMLMNPDSKESSGLSEFLLALSLKRLQIKKNHLPDFENHCLDQAKHSMAWILAEQLQPPSPEVEVIDVPL